MNRLEPYDGKLSRTVLRGTGVGNGSGLPGGGEMSLTEKITSAINTYLGAFERQDLDAIMDLFADDCWVEDPVGSERRVGREALREFYRVGVKIGPKMTLESEIRVAGNEAAFAFRLEADLPNGKLSVRPIDVMVFNDEGKVISMRAYFGPTNQTIPS